MKSVRLKSALLVLVAALAGSLPFIGSTALPVTAAITPTTDGRTVQLPSLAPVLDVAMPAVVNVSTRGHVAAPNNPLLNDPFFRQFFDERNIPRERQTQSLGSGVIVDAARGYILTNNHVVADADEVTVTLRDGRNLKAKLIGSDKETDVAVIQVPADDLKAVPLADSSKLRVGDFVVAIGNPFGLGQTATSGIVSAVGRNGLGLLGAGGYEDFIQTDASINPGNSGGALINLSGELVGINTAILAPGGGNIGIGFAIPINMAQNVMQQLIKTGKVQRGALGVQIQSLTPELSQAFDLPSPKGPGGALITQVVPDSPADKAGLRAGDIIAAVDGNMVRDASTLRNSIGLLPLGQKVKLDVLRKGRARTIEITVAANGSAAIKTASGKTASGDDPRLAGVVFGAVDPRSPWYGRIEGIPVIDVKSGTPAARAGLQPRDLVVSINQQAVRTPDDLVNATQGDRQSPLLMNIQRGEGALFIAIPAP